MQDMDLAFEVDRLSADLPAAFQAWGGARAPARP